MRKVLSIISLFILLASLLSGEKIQYLKKIGEIKDGFSSEKENFFIRITGLCCDDDGNLYVADSKWNKIFKFDSNGKFLMSFGRQGQGPGEFMAQRRRNHLRISFGNDKKLYVMDPGNNRLSVFSKDGKFIKSFRVILPYEPYDTPVVNSKGDIYLFSSSEIKVIDRYNSNFKLLSSLLDIDLYFQFPFGFKPSWSYYPFPKTPDDFSAKKLITKNDELIVICNYFPKVFIFDRNDRKIGEFSINEPRIMEDYKKFFKEVTKDKHVKSVVFDCAFLSKEGNICLLYERKDDKSHEIYIYGLNGRLLGLWKVPGKLLWAPYATSNKSGRIYIAKEEKEEMRIGIYEIGG